MSKSTEVGSEWYIVSMEWIFKWQKFVKFGGESDQAGEHPGFIDNSDIILKYEYTALEDRYKRDDEAKEVESVFLSEM